MAFGTRSAGSVGAVIAVCSAVGDVGETMASGSAIAVAGRVATVGVVTVGAELPSSSKTIEGSQPSIKPMTIKRGITMWEAVNL